MFWVAGACLQVSVFGAFGGDGRVVETGCG